MESFHRYIEKLPEKSQRDIPHNGLRRIIETRYNGNIHDNTHDDQLGKEYALHGQYS